MLGEGYSDVWRPQKHCLGSTGTCPAGLSHLQKEKCLFQSVAGTHKGHPRPGSGPLFPKERGAASRRSLGNSGCLFQETDRHRAHRCLLNNARHPLLTLCTALLPSLICAVRLVPSPVIVLESRAGNKGTNICPEKL